MSTKQGQPQGGGGGGGGGRYPGGGGIASFGGLWSGGGGGGGGSSLYDALAQAKVLTGWAGRQGDGVITISWTYAPTWSFAKLGTPTTQALQGEDANGSSSAAAVDTRTVTQDDGKASPRQQWAYLSEQGKTDGQLINQQTGLCLEVNGNSGAVDQWPCDARSANHRWTLIPHDNGISTLRIELPDGDTPWAAGTYYLATATASDQVADGTSLTLLSSDRDDRTSWSAVPQE